MKKLFTLVAISIALTIISSCGVCGCNSKYTIESGSRVYYTNMIDESGEGCISFTDSDKSRVKLCGNYSVTVNKDWKPNQKEQ